jgi:hypothetical protein
MSGPPIPVPIDEIKRRIKEAGFELLYYDTREFPNPTLKDIVRFHVSQFEPLVSEYLCKYNENIFPETECIEEVRNLNRILLPFKNISIINVVASLYNPKPKKNEPPCPHKWFVLDQNPKPFYPCITKEYLIQIALAMGSLSACIPSLRPIVDDINLFINRLHITNPCEIGRQLVPYINTMVDIISEPLPQPPPGPVLPVPGPELPPPPPPFQPPGPPDINTPEFKVRYPNLSGLLLVIKEWVKPGSDAKKNGYRTQIETYLKEMSDEEIALFRPMPEFVTIQPIRTKLPEMYKGKPFKAKLIGGRRSRHRPRRTRKHSRS